MAAPLRTEHEFFGHVCDALAGIQEVLVVVPRTAQSDFRHYVEKHRPRRRGASSATRPPTTRPRTSSSRSRQYFLSSTRPHERHADADLNAGSPGSNGPPGRVSREP